MTRVYYSLYDRMLSKERLQKAFQKVKSNKGAAGVDGQTIEDFAGDLQMNLDMLVKELKEKSYRPQPVKRVEIPKAGGEKRKLGIPTVRDRVVQQTLLNILQPIFDPEFHPSSYGYRPCRSCHQAIAKATMFIRNYERKWVVDMDLTKCFDTLDHDIIIKAFRKRVTDGSILKLLRMFLQSGVMTEEGWHASTEGSPQGKLKLTVNQQKTHIVHSSEGVKFLGVIIRTGFTGIQEKKMREFKEKVKRITRKNSPVNLEKVIADLNPLVRGYANYFRIANCKKVFDRLSRWIRRRLRAKQLTLWKKPKRLHRRLRQLGYKGEFKAIKMSSWRNAASPLASFAIPNKYLRELGLFDLCSVQTGIPVSI